MIQYACLGRCIVSVYRFTASVPAGAVFLLVSYSVSVGDYLSPTEVFYYFSNIHNLCTFHLSVIPQYFYDFVDINKMVLKLSTQLYDLTDYPNRLAPDFFI